MEKLNDLLRLGQSYWLDNLTRKKINDGELKKRVTRQGLRGITSNPDIFNKAITGSSDYDVQIAALARDGKTPSEIYDELTIKDIRDACDILKPVFEESGRTDGFVSLEVSPFLARDTTNSLTEAHRLFHAVDRENCMIKLPGTAEGVAAIEQALYEGININITLLFSAERYVQVAEAYIHALERRLADGRPINNIHSVASVFISRIDVLVDQLIAHRIIPEETREKEHLLRMLFGKAGIATAQQCYHHFRQLFHNDRWRKLEENLAHVQRPLWASTSAKNPLYADLIYVDSLIAQDTVNTLPDKTIAAFEQRGTLKKNALLENEDPDKVMNNLQVAGIDRKSVAQQLEDEGVQKFIEAYNQLLENIAEKRRNANENEVSVQTISAGDLDKAIMSAGAFLGERQTVKRIFRKDQFLWSDKEETANEIRQHIDWLDLPDSFEALAKDITDFAQVVKAEGFKDAVLLGMGGSSLSSEVARQFFGTADGFLRLHVLDNTSPEAIQNIEHKIDLSKALFIVASKSGSTQETIFFYRYFRQCVEAAGSKEPGEHFIAITDTETPLAKLGAKENFRKVFINPTGVGGRYSALSFFGLVPMALIGVNVIELLAHVRTIKNTWKDTPAAANPPVSLGTALGVCQKNGRDKVTFLLSPSMRAFGFWLEQLLAESTGKMGRGLIPVHGEVIGPPEVYNNDRVFVHIHLASEESDQQNNRLALLRNAGHPVIEISVKEKIMLGTEFYRWEIATAVAGMFIRINPFDQPDVEESKKNTREILKSRSEGKLPEPEGNAIKTGPFLICSGNSISPGETATSAGDYLWHFLQSTTENGYTALLPYFLMSESRQQVLNSWRQGLRDELKTATVLLEGPRYLHSIGQLHKGGPGTGSFILMVSDEQDDLTIPGENFTFKTLQLAQAYGNFRSLSNKKRNVLLIHLGKHIDAGLSELYASFEDARKHFANALHDHH